jgi:hypothetical protein
MNRKYPILFFFMGLLQSMIRYFFIGLIGIVLWIIGLYGIEFCKVCSVIILAGYLLICVVEQIIFCFVSLQESENPELNEFLDIAFGANNKGENNKSAHQRIIDHVNSIIKDQNEKNDDDDNDNDT